MEKVEYHTPEEKEACDLIKYSRRYHHEMYSRKTIWVNCIKEDNKQIRAGLNISVNKRTGTVSLSHCLRHGTYSRIYPTTNQKLKCTNQHAIEALHYHKKMLSPDRRNEIRFYEIIEPYIGILERISYYNDTGNVGITCCFNAAHKHKLKIIDELDAQASIDGV